MLNSASGIQLPYVSLEQALTNIIDSISKEEAAVAGILNSQGEIIKKIGNLSGNVEEFVSLNISINDIMRNVVRLQMLLQLKLEEAQRFLHKIDDIDELGE